MKYIGIVCMACLACVLFSLWIVHWIQSRQKQPMSRVKKTLLVMILTLALGVCGTFGYLQRYYPVGKEAKASLESRDNVTVTELDYGYFFDGPSTDTAMIFYPGAKVETAAYAPLMNQLAQHGIDCFLIEMPFHMALFDGNAAETVLSSYTYSEWILAGHSLGGNVASSFVQSHSESVDALILLASYPSQPLEGIRLCSIYGSKDGCLNREQYDKNKKNWPSKSMEICIPGGNHAQFGDYGSQKGDGQATISARSQQKKTAEIIVQFIKEEG